jgi:hypothetical protein
MKFDPISRALYTDEGQFLKILHCPMRKRWQELNLTGPEAHRNCNHCERIVFDTAELSDLQIVELLHDDPDTCLKVSLDQSNIRSSPISRPVNKDSGNR